MKVKSVSIKDILFGFILTITMDIAISLVLAYLISVNMIPYSAADICCVLSASGASLCGSSFVVKRSGMGISGYMLGGIVIIFLTVSGLILFQTDMTVSAITKTAVAVFIGVLLGKFLGHTRHNRLRKTKKKKPVYTK